MAGTKPRTGAIDVLRTWLLTRWNPDARMLDLSVSACVRIACHDCFSALSKDHS